MREPMPGVKFNAVLNLFTSFGYFDDLTDNQKVIDAIHEMLLPEGLLVIDFMNAERVVKKLVKQEVKEVDGIEFHVKRNFDGQHIFKTIDFKDNGKNFSFTERVQALKESDFTAMLALRGFKIIRTFGNFDLSSFDEKTSDRLIIIAKKS
jgi:SAM-dependent methyltransferase